MLDTNVCSYLMRSRPTSVVERLRILGPDRVAVSVITAIELRQGADASASPKRYHAAIDAFLAEVAVLSLGEEVVRAVAGVRASPRKIGKPIGDMDSLIAGHARALGMVLVTHNTREFDRVHGLRVEDWV